MPRKFIIISNILILTAGLCFGFGNVNQNAESVSLSQLIATPGKYHGKVVRIIGVARIEFEGDSIWFTKEHYVHRIYENSLWIIPNYKALNTTRTKLERMNGKYVLMEGIFNKDKHGHGGIFSGTLENVTRFQIWEKE
jgi:hypothetical protein